MAVLFSHITLSAENGSTETFLCGGIPDRPLYEKVSKKHRRTSYVLYKESSHTNHRTCSIRYGSG